MMTIIISIIYSFVYYYYTIISTIITIMLLLLSTIISTIITITLTIIIHLIIISLHIGYPGPCRGNIYIWVILLVVALRTTRNQDALLVAPATLREATSKEKEHIGYPGPGRRRAADHEITLRSYSQQLLTSGNLRCIRCINLCLRSYTISLRLHILELCMLRFIHIHQLFRIQYTSF